MFGVLALACVCSLILPGPGEACLADAWFVIHQQTDLTCVGQDGMILWQGPEHSPSGLSDSHFRSPDSLALIAQWTVPGNCSSSGGLQWFDLNSNGIPDLSYSVYGDSTFVFEAAANDSFRLVHAVRNPYVGFAGRLVCCGDGDADGLAEFVYTTGSSGVPRYLVFREARRIGAYPDSTVLTLPEINIGGVPHMRTGDLDGDGLREYIGSTQGSSEMQVAVWENRGDNAYEQVYATRLGEGGVSGEIAVGDFDGDGRGDIAAPHTGSSFTISVIESRGNDAYEIVWQEPVPTENIYWTTPGPDLDRDGRGDFVVTGGEGWGGDVTWSFLMYESTGDDHYELVWSYQVHSAMIHGGAATGDLDNDGWPELICQVPDRTMIFRAAGDNNLELCWDHPGPVMGQGEHRLISPDLDGDRRGEAIWWLSNDPGELVIYEWVPLVSDVSVLSENGLSLAIMNPCISGGRISYALDGAGLVRLDILDVLGRHVATLVNREETAGMHTVVWNPLPVPRGMHFCRLRTGRAIATGKLVFSD